MFRAVQERTPGKNDKDGACRQHLGGYGDHTRE